MVLETIALILALLVIIGLVIAVVYGLFTVARTIFEVVKGRMARKQCLHERRRRCHGQERNLGAYRCLDCKKWLT